jgi:hypothetical protein
VGGKVEVVPVETKALERQRKLKRAAKAAVIGAILALACRALPAEYQHPCEVIIKVCTGNL